MEYVMKKVRYIAVMAMQEKVTDVLKIKNMIELLNKYLKILSTNFRF